MLAVVPTDTYNLHLFEKTVYLFDIQRLVVTRIELYHIDTALKLRKLLQKYVFEGLSIFCRFELTDTYLPERSMPLGSDLFVWHTLF